MNNESHWTERNIEDFLYSIASDFIEQLQSKMKVIGMTQSSLAKATKLSKGRISQVFKDPGNLELETMIKFARALSMKVSVLAYEDVDDPQNERGPINAEVFRLCWNHLKRPADMWSFKQNAQATTITKVSLYYAPQGLHNWRQLRAVQTPDKVRTKYGYTKTQFAGGLLSTNAEEASLSELLSGIRQHM